MLERKLIPSGTDFYSFFMLFPDSFKYIKKDTESYVLTFYFLFYGVPTIYYILSSCFAEFDHEDTSFKVQRAIAIVTGLLVFGLTVSAWEMSFLSLIFLLMHVAGSLCFGGGLAYRFNE
jgi:hypothetical protein